MKKLILPLLLLLCNASLYAQTTVAQISYNYDEIDGFHATPINEKGVIVSTRGTKKTGTKVKWTFSHYDKDLKKQKDGSSLLEANQSVLLDFATDNKFYLLFESLRKLSIAHGNTNSMTVSVKNVDMPSNSYITDFKILGDFAYIVYYTRKLTSHVIQLNLKTGQKRIITLHKKETKPNRSIPAGVQIIEEKQEIWFCMSTHASKKTRELGYTKFNIKGEQVPYTSLADASELVCLEVAGSPNSDESYSVFGTYTQDPESGSQGIYFGELKDDKLEILETKEFNEFYFYDELIKQEKKYIEKQARFTKYKVFIDELRRLPDGYLLIMEAYIPEVDFQREIGPINGYIGNQFKHGLVVKFDNAGNEVWSTMVRIGQFWNEGPYGRDRYLAVANKNNQFNLVYSYFGIIKQKSLGLKGQILQESEDVYKEKEGGVKVKSRFQDLRFWYDNYIIRYGYEKTKGDGKKKKELVVKKVSVH